MAKMQIEHYVVGPVQTNCYFVINRDSYEMLIIDPGASARSLIDRILKNGYHPKAILLTHGHFDHAGGAAEIAREFEIPVLVHEAERDTLPDPDLNGSWMLGREETYHADIFLKDEQELDLAGFHFRVLFTPGHTPGGCCYYFPYEGTVFTGDALFAGSIGRTDFPKGSMSQLVRAIRDKLMTLPENTVCYPGHNEQTTIGEERTGNPYL